MKMKTTRICARKGCKKEFRLYKSTDKYCSGECAFISQKAKPKKKQTPIKPYSEKRKRESYTYTKKRKTFLLNLDDKFCPVAREVFNEEIPVTEIHHKASRRGKLLNYVPYWLAVCRKGHNWIHNNPKDAIERGFLIPSTSVKI